MPPIKGFTLWLTGLSGSGKSSLAAELVRQLHDYGVPNVEILDGDVVRPHLGQGLSFSKQDRDINIHRIAFVCQLLTRNGVANIAAVISPYQEARAEARRMIGDFIEIYVATPIEVCKARDSKGLYRRAESGEIPAFTGVSDPYEPPTHPDVVCLPLEETLQVSAAKVIALLVERGYVAPVGSAPHPSNP